VATGRTEVIIEHLHGAVSRVDQDETAFNHRDAEFSFLIDSKWADPAESEKHIRWTRDYFSAMEPFYVGGAYINYLGDEGEDRVKAAYGAAKYQRLTALKNTYDPTNLFHLNQNIRPAV
jgi:FAD/FMN-containing dehydrogenase